MIVWVRRSATEYYAVKDLVRVCSIAIAHSFEYRHISRKWALS